MKPEKSQTNRPPRRPAAAARKQAARLEHLEALLNSTLDGILVIDEDQKIILFNRAAEELFRCPASEALGTALDRFIPMEAREKHRKLVSAFGRSADSRRTMSAPALNLRCLRADGTEFDGEISISRHLEEGHHVYAAIIRDNTARIEAERQYKESEMQWRSLFENMLDAVARGRVEYAEGQPVDWVYLEVNPAFERLTGLSNVVGKKVSELIPGFIESNGEMLAQFGEVVATGVPHAMESFVPGLESWFKISAYRPRPGEFIAVFDNITAQKLAALEIESQAKFAAENPAPVLRVNQDGVVQYANPASAGLLRMWSCAVGEPAPAAWRELAGRALATGETRTRETECQGRIYSMFVVPVMQRGYVNLYGRDITERQQAEREREALLEIMKGAASTENLQDFLSLVRQSLSKILAAENFFVVLHDERTGQFEEVFSVDKYDAPMPPAALEKSLTSYVFRTGEALLATQATFEELSRRGDVELVGNDSASWLGAPLRTAHATIGVIAVQDYERPDSYTERDRDFLASVAAEVALAVQRKRAEDQVRQRAHELQMLYETSLDVMAETSFDRLLSVIVERAASLLGTDSGTLYLMEPDGRAIRLTVVHNFPPSFIGTTLKLGEGMSGVVAQTGKPMQVGDYASWPGRSEAWKGIPIRRVLAIPLKAKEQLIGVINVADSMQAGQFSEHEIQLGGLFANQAAMVIQRKRAEENLKQSEARLRAIVDTTPFPLALVDTEDDKIEMWSQSATELFGHTAPSASGWYELAYPDPDYRKEVIARWKPALEKARASGQTVNTGEYRIACRDGSIRTCELYATFLGDRLIVTFNDITERKEAQERVRRQLEHVSALRDIDRTLVGSVDLRVTLSGVVSHAMRELGLDAACIVLLDTTMQTLRCAASAGFRTHALQRLEIPARGGLASTLAAGSGLGQGTGPLATQSVFAGRPEFAAEGIVTCFAVPLVVKGDFRGVMEVYLRRPFSPDTDWLDFLGTLGGQVAVAIDSSSLFEHEQRSHNDMLQAYDATIEGWSRALDLRDKETEGHTQRVTRMTIELARALGMTEEQLVHVRRGALLHDIGKLGVPDAILLKPGPLTDEEWVLMKQHPALAHGMLSPIDYLRPALDIPWCHHEKWDGSGYPRGLAGEAIPLSARIFSVVDVWDALTSDRPYRPRWTRERAIEHIRSQSGVDFDPRVAAEFLARELWKLAD